ncbi:aldo/keto reductase [Phytomonospora sp. NPDC050363]|uniref:aldo/keto reductase n=1 Tax=Phytomonospora sp. NPDC050363 TaxID=3155642 RepID=UPI0033DB8D33
MTVKLALGVMNFGTTTDEETSVALLDRFVEAGGTMIDTANCYSFWSDDSGLGGQSEELLGRWFAARSGVRDRVVLSTKCGAEPTEAHGDWPANREGLGTAAIGEALKASLKRLGTDRVEYYWAHMEDRRVPVEETVAAFGALAAEGLVGKLGASNHATWLVERARAIAAAQGVAGYTALQLSHSYVKPRPEAGKLSGHRFGFFTDETMDYAVTEGLEVWAYSPLLVGSYVRADRPLPESYDHPGTTRRLAALAKVADELGVTRNQVVLAWLTGGEPNAVPIVGVSSVAQLDEAIAGVALELSPEHRTELDAAV